MHVDDLPSFKRMQESRLGFKIIFKIYSFLRILGIKNKKLDLAKQQFEGLESKMEEHKKYTVKFNKYFSDDGWIVHDSLNYDLMKNAVDLFDSKGVEEAKQLLLEHFGPEKVEERLFLVNKCKEMRLRHRLIHLALKDYKENRNHAVIPLLLMIIDGVVADVTEKMGFHADGVDLNVWDNITQVDGGINKMKEIFQQSRKKTREEPINMPYRHGILHGRDLSYDNIEVAAKSWCFLFAISDWAYAKTTEEDRKKQYLDASKNPTLKEITDFMSETERMKEGIVQWSPRKLDGEYIKSITEGRTLDNGLPEYIVLKYFELWKEKNYGFMSDLYAKSYKLSPGELRDIYDGWNLINFEFVSIKEDAPALTNITISATFDGIGKKQVKIILLHERADGSPLPGNMQGAEWHITQLYMV